jgi:hypothetical protein
MNQLQAVALNEGLRCKKRLRRERGRRQLEAFRHMAELIHNEAFVEKIIGFAAKYRAHSTLLRSIRTAGVGKLRWITTPGYLGLRSAISTIPSACICLLTKSL